MEEVIQQPSKSRKVAMIKASIFLLFIVLAIYVIRFTPVKDYFNQEALGRFLIPWAFGLLSYSC